MGPTQQLSQLDNREGGRKIKTPQEINPNAIIDFLLNYPLLTLTVKKLIILNLLLLILAALIIYRYRRVIRREIKKKTVYIIRKEGETIEILKKRTTDRKVNIRNQAHILTKKTLLGHDPRGNEVHIIGADKYRIKGKNGKEETVTPETLELLLKGTALKQYFGTLEIETKTLILYILAGAGGMVILQEIMKVLIVMINKSAGG